MSMAQLLPCEILDKILAKLSPFYHSHHRPALLAVYHLKAASKVCVSWHQSAQKRLQSIVKLETARDLARLVASPTARPEYCRALVACFYDSTLPEDEQLRPSVLAAELHRFPALQYLHVETHRMDDDLTLSALIASCTKIHSLVIEHASEPVPVKSEYSDSESDDDDDEFEIDRSRERYETGSVAHLPSLVSQCISKLTALSHLALIRIDLGEEETRPHPPSNLKSLAFVLCVMRKDILSWFLTDAKGLNHLSLIHPMHITKEGIVEAVTHVATQLRHLALTIPWPEDGSPPHLAATTTLLQGVVSETALLCRNLRSLRSQDPQVNVSILRDLKYLEILSLAVRDTEALDVQLSLGFPSLEDLTLDIHRLSMNAWDKFKSRWKYRSWDLSALSGMGPIRYNPMKDFCATIRDPLEY